VNTIMNLRVPQKAGAYFITWVAISSWRTLLYGVSYTGWFKIIVGVSVAYNLQTRNNKIKLLTEYEGVTQKVLFANAVLAALMSGRKYDVITQIGDVVT
jgi:hypothetical protein